MEIPQQRQEGKVDLITLTSELMPKGVPNLLGVVKYPQIERLGQEIGKKGVLLLILTLVKDLCSSINVVRNMSEDQMLETASMLLDECGDFRLEDYVIMFSMLKRGQLVKIYDRIDTGLVGDAMNEYWFMRRNAGRRHQEEEVNHFEDKLKEIERKPGSLTEEENEQQIELISKLREVAANLCAPDEKQLEIDEKELKYRLNKHVEFFKSTLTPEQLKEIENRRREIEKAASLYELEQKEKSGKEK